MPERVTSYGFTLPKATVLSGIADRELTRIRNGGGVNYPDSLPQTCERYVGKTTASHAKGVAQSVNRYQQISTHFDTQVTSTSHLEDSGTDDTVMNLFANVGSGKWVKYVRVGASFYLESAEC